MFTWLASSCYCPLILFSDQPPNDSFILIINILSWFLVFGIDWFQEIWCCFRYWTSSTRFPSLFGHFCSVKKLICVDKLFFFVPRVFHCEWWYCFKNVRLSVGISVLTLYKLLKGPLYVCRSILRWLLFSEMNAITGLNLFIQQWITFIMTVNYEKTQKWKHHGQGFINVVEWFCPWST